MQLQRGVDGGVCRAEVELVLASSLGTRRRSPTRLDFSKQLPKRLENIVEYCLFTALIADNFHPDQLGDEQYDQLRRSGVHQPLQVHDSDLSGEVLDRVKRHPDPVAGEDSRHVRELERSQLLEVR